MLLHFFVGYHFFGPLEIRVTLRVKKFSLVTTCSVRIVYLLHSCRWYTTATSQLDRNASFMLIIVIDMWNASNVFNAILRFYNKRRIIAPLGHQKIE